MKKKLKKKVDKKIFRNTAERTKAINLSPVTSRGGIRLQTSSNLNYRKSCFLMKGVLFMSELKYVVRFFKDDQYLYSIHCDHEVLNEIVAKADADGQKIKIVAYVSDEKQF